MIGRASEPIRIQGRAWASGVMYTSFGIALLLPFALFLFTPSGAQVPLPLQFGLLVYGTLLLVVGLALAMLGYGVHLLRARTFEVDDSGAKFLLGGRELWAISWDDIASVGVRSSTGGGRLTRVFVRAEKGNRELILGENFGPRRQIEAAFRALAARAPAGVLVEDAMGWAGDIRPAPAVGKSVSAILKPEAAGVWHPSDGFRREAKEIGLILAVIVMAPPAMAVWEFSNGATARYAVDTFVTGAIIFWGMMIAVFGWSLWDSPTAVRFDARGVALQFRRNRVRGAPWEAVTQCENDDSRESIVLAFTPSGGRRRIHAAAYLDLEVRQGILSAFAAARTWKKT